MNTIPSFLKERLEHQYGESSRKIEEGFLKKTVTFRINRLKTTLEEIKEVLEQENISYETVSWYEDAFLIRNRNEEEIRRLSIYQEGKIYLQSLSSMLPVLFLDPKGTDHILDMAAAPGGKTAQIASLTGNQAMIMACEKNPIRFERLKYNLDKQGVKRTTILKTDARTLDEYFSFDKILLDAPCSGSGTLDISSEQNSSFQEELVKRCSNRQLTLLRKAISLLKKGGILIYSTCSILEEENETVVRQVLEEKKVELVPISLPEIPFLSSTLPGTLVVCPTKDYEGFFVAKLRKR